MGGDGGNTKAGACSSLEIVYTSLIFIFPNLFLCSGVLCVLAETRKAEKLKS